MAHKWQGPFFVKEIETLNCSVNGNPRYRVTLDDGTETITSSDSACVYSIPNYARNGRAIMVEFTRAGRISWIRSASPLDTMVGSR